VPEERVPADLLAVGLREGDDGVVAGEVVDVGLRVDLGPLHVVLGGQRAELGAEDVLELSGVLGVVVEEVTLTPHGTADLEITRRLGAQGRFRRVGLGRSPR
jgi:hypothetical protein